LFIQTEPKAYAYASSRKRRIVNKIVTERGVYILAGVLTILFGVIIKRGSKLLSKLSKSSHLSLRL
jgi:hypothetical protein